MNLKKGGIMKNTKLVKGFKRWPSDAGVTFEGFEEIRLKSREEVRKKLEDFIKYCLDSKKPAIRVLLGEWGEGKTDAFNRYIKPRVEATKNYAFLISASTLSNAYNPESGAIYKLLNSTTLSASKFIAALLYAIKEENHVDKIPDCSSYEHAEDYILHCLNNLLGSIEHKKLFVFIDEFEELLLEKGTKLKDIISGIKETINGQFEPIDEKGQYAGCLHLIVAATPDAYYRLEVTEDIALVFGGLGRRAGVIELPIVTKAEGIGFFLALLRYAYNGHLPKELPIENLGIFHTLYRIAQGNPGNMVSLFTRLFSSAKHNNNIEIVNEDVFLRFLRGEKIFIYGGSAPCLESEVFDRIIRTLSEQRTKELGEACAKVLKKIVSNVIPWSENQLKAHVRSYNVSNIVGMIINELKNREKIEKAIIKVAPLRKDKTLDDVKAAFGEFIKTSRNEKYIKIDNFECSFKEFVDMITFFDFDQNREMITKIFLPTDRNNLLHFFEGINEERSIELENMIKRRKLCEDERYYLASETLLSQIYPSPVPRELEFIKNREKRMKIWRDITKNLSDYYENYMPIAFINLLERSGIFHLKIKEITLPENIEVAEVQFNDVKFTAMFYSVNGDVKSDDIEDISRQLRSLKPVHCVILLFTGEIMEEAKEKISDKELGPEGENRIVEIKLHPTLAKRILAIYLAERGGVAEDISSELLESVIKNTVTIDLDLENKMKEWLRSQESKGLAIIDIPSESTLDLGELADAQKFYINFLGKEMDPEEVFDENQKILKFIKPETKKVALIPDIEKPKFQRISVDLEKNGFLIRKNGKLIVKKHPVEEKILNILKKEQKVSKEDLLKYFILKNPKHLTEVFLPMLEYKGLIQGEAGYYSLTDESKLSEEVEQNYQRFLKICEKEEWKNFGFVLMTKEKGYRFFSLTEFRNLLVLLHREIQQMRRLENELVLQKLSLLQKLLFHFFEVYYPLIKQSIEAKEYMLSKIKNARDEFEERISSIQKECDKWLKIKFDTKNVKEVREIKELINEIQESEKESLEELTKIVEEINKDEEKRKAFFFRKSDDEANYFNLKLYLIVETCKKIERYVEDKRKTLEEIEKIFGALNETKNRLKEKLLELRVPDEFEISTKVAQILKDILENVLPAEPLSMASVCLSDILDETKKEEKSLHGVLDTVHQCLGAFEELVSTEKLFISLNYTSNNVLMKAKQFFDTSDYKELVGSSEQNIGKIKEEYKKLISKVDFRKSPEHLLSKIKDLQENIKLIEEKIQKELNKLEEEWKNYIQRYITKLTNMSKLLNVVGQHVKEKERLFSQIEGAEKQLSIEKIEESNLTVSKINNMINVIEEEFYEQIKNILSKDEVFVLEFIISHKEKRWIPANEIINSTAGKTQCDIKEVLRKLVEKGILQEGYTLIF